MTQQNWVEKAETFARVRAHMRQVLAASGEPLDMAELLTEFKFRFRYLPNGFERRMRELLQSGDVVRTDGSVPTFKLRESNLTRLNV